MIFDEEDEDRIILLQNYTGLNDFIRGWREEKCHESISFWTHGRLSKNSGKCSLAL